MSYILDALKKSEQDRGHGAVPGVQTVHSSSLNYRQEKHPVWPWFLVALVAINLVAITYFIQSKDKKESVSTTQSEAISETTAHVDIQTEPVTTAVSAARTSAPNVVVIAQASRPVQEETTALETQAAQQTNVIEPVFETVDLYDLPPNVRQHIPAMDFSAHVYSSNPLQRSLVINGRFMEEGSEVTSELILTEITSNGAVFDFHGHRFRTNVLSGWN